MAWSVFFQSHNGGVTAYDNDVYSNNICYKISNIAIDIYLNNTTNQISYNDILNVDVNVLRIDVGRVCHPRRNPVCGRVIDMNSRRIANVTNSTRPNYGGIAGKTTGSWHWI